MCQWYRVKFFLFFKNSYDLKNRIDSLEIVKFYNNDLFIVGCIPKKMMHLAALNGHIVEDAPMYGWNVSLKKPHEWGKLVQNVQDRVKASNWTYR